MRIGRYVKFGRFVDGKHTISGSFTNVYRGRQRLSPCSCPDVVFPTGPYPCSRAFSFLMKWLLLPQRRPISFSFRFCAREHRDIDVRPPSKPTCTSRRDKYHEAARVSIKYFYTIYLPLTSVTVTLLPSSPFSYSFQRLSFNLVHLCD